MSYKELERIAFIENRDGKTGAIEFVTQTLATYKRALLTSRKRGHVKPHHASTLEYRRTFIESCVIFKQYLRNQNAKNIIGDI